MSTTATKRLMILDLAIQERRIVWNRVYGEVLVVEMKRQLTQREFERIFAVAQRYQLPATIESAESGFGFEVTFWLHKDRLISFVSGHIPKSLLPAKGDYDKRIRAKLKLVMPFLRSKRNLRLLTDSELPHPREETAYIY